MMETPAIMPQKYETLKSTIPAPMSLASMLEKSEPFATRSLFHPIKSTHQRHPSWSRTKHAHGVAHSCECLCAHDVPALNLTVAERIRFAASTVTLRWENADIG